MIKRGNRKNRQQTSACRSRTYQNNRTNWIQRRQLNRWKSFDIVFFSFLHDVETEEEIKEDPSILSKRSKPRNGTAGQEEREPGPASIGSMASVDIESDMFWNTPLSSVLMSRFLRVYLGGGFFPRAYQEGIYVSCYPVFYCNANRVHRKKFWPVETWHFDGFLFHRFSFRFVSSLIGPELPNWLTIDRTS